ncbi:MAG: alpha/beta fold hydrolase [Bacteroidota bacterium]
MKLYYRKFGRGKPLFILHGLFGLSDNWATVGKILSEFFEVYLVDLRNFGQSPHSDKWTYPVMANDILELIENVLKDKQPNDEHLNENSSAICHLPSAILMGHSLGGKVAMQFASMYPQKLEKLIVVDMSPKDYPLFDRSLIDNLLAMDLEKIKSRKEADEKISSFVKESAVRQLLSKNIYWKEKSGSGSSSVLDWKFNLKKISENVSTIGKTFSIDEKEINTPALFIRGEKSNYILDSDIPQIKKYFSHAEFKTIEGAGHWVHADKPEEFAEVVNKFTLPNFEPLYLKFVSGFGFS